MEAKLTTLVDICVKHDQLYLTFVPNVIILSLVACGEDGF